MKLRVGPGVLASWRSLRSHWMEEGVGWAGPRAQCKVMREPVSAGREVRVSKAAPRGGSREGKEAGLRWKGGAKGDWLKGHVPHPHPMATLTTLPPP